jgi:hypothetical protein
MITDEEEADLSSQSIGAKTDKLRHRLLEKCLHMLESGTLELAQMKFCRDVIKEMEDYTPSVPEEAPERSLPFVDRTITV